MDLRREQGVPPLALRGLADTGGSIREFVRDLRGMGWLPD